MMGDISSKKRLKGRIGRKGKKILRRTYKECRDKNLTAILRVMIYVRILKGNEE
jgi:hypothetical protein